MNLHHGIALFIALVVSGVCPARADRNPWAQVRADAIHAHVDFLASDLLEGRAAGSRGHELAAAYVAAQFRQYGLKAAGDNEGSYLQTVPLLEATAVLPGSSAELNIDRETVSFEYGRDYLPAADYVASTSTLSAPLAFVGFGISAPELNYDDFTGVDVRGRIALVLSNAPAQFPPQQRTYYAWPEAKYANLIGRGAVGLIAIDTPDQAGRTPWDRRVAMSWVPQMRWLDDEGAPVDAHPQIKLRFGFEAAAAARLFEDGPRTLDEAFAAAAAGEPQGFTLPGMMTLSATTGLRRTSSSNVLAVLEGSEPQLRGEYVVMTAHLDHLGRGAAVNGDSVYNGAHDNAAGVAILLETARTMAAMSVRPRRSIVFAAVTAEEKGQLGSDYLAEHPPAGMGSIVAAFNADTPLAFARTQDVIVLGAEHSSLGSVATRAAQAQGYRLSANDLPDDFQLLQGDQFSFIRRGIPALRLQVGHRPRDARVDLKALRQEFMLQHHRQPSDDGALPFDPAAAADLAAIYARMALEVADAAAKPRWNKADFLAGKFRPAQ